MTTVITKIAEDVIEIKVTGVYRREDTDAIELGVSGAFVKGKKLHLLINVVGIEKGSVKDVSNYVSKVRRLKNYTYFPYIGRIAFVSRAGKYKKFVAVNAFVFKYLGVPIKYFDAGEYEAAKTFVLAGKK